jgi:hypothetical protein
MSIVKTWGFGTTTDADTDVTPKSVNPVSEFALIKDEQDECRLQKSQAIDNASQISYQYRDIGSVQTNIKSVHPLKVKNGVQYAVRLDAQMKLTSSDDATYAETVPFVGMVILRHPKNGNIVNSDLDTFFAELIGACYKEVSGSVSTRFGDLMQSALRPTADGIDAKS